MSFLKREWTDAEKWIAGLAATALTALGAFVWNSFSGDVIADIASRRDQYGRCLDAEVLVRNDTKTDARDIEIVFDVDYFTRRGDVSLEFGDERDQLIPPGQTTLLPRLPYVPVATTMDSAKSVLVIPRLMPGQYVHLYYGGEPQHDSVMANVRDKLLMSRYEDVMNKPRVSQVSRTEGVVIVRRKVHCAAL